MQEEVSLIVKIAGVGVAFLALLGGIFGGLWKLATRQFVKKDELNEKLNFERESFQATLEKQYNSYKEVIEEHSNEEMAIFRAQDQRLEEMNAIIKDLHHNIQSMPSRQEMEYQQRVTDNLRASMDELTKCIYQISGKLDTRQVNFRATEDKNEQ